MSGKFILVDEEFQQKVLQEIDGIKKLLQQNNREVIRKTGNELMDTADVMAYLKCSRRSVYKYRLAGMPSERKENGRIRYWRSEIDKYFGKK